MTGAKGQPRLALDQDITTRNPTRSAAQLCATHFHVQFSCSARLPDLPSCSLVFRFMDSPRLAVRHTLLAGPLNVPLPKHRGPTATTPIPRKHPHGPPFSLAALPSVCQTRLQVLTLTSHSHRRQRGAALPLVVGLCRPLPRIRRALDRYAESGKEATRRRRTS